MTTIGIITDLHLGGSGTGRWHNRLLYDYAEEATRAAIEELNRQSPDVALILGDVTEHGKLEELLKVYQLCAEMKFPWYIVPGNHDRAAVRSGQFENVFAEHALPPFLSFEGLNIVAPREWVEGAQGNEYKIDTSRAKSSLDFIHGASPEIPLVIASHFPLLPEQEWADSNAGRYAGHLDSGIAWLQRLHNDERKMRPIILCGHSHWHHIIETPLAIQCTTAAMIEYPMEARLITITSSSITIETLVTRTPEIAGNSFDEITYTAGRPEDRNVKLSLRAK